MAQILPASALYIHEVFGRAAAEEIEEEFVLIQMLPTGSMAVKSVSNGQTYVMEWHDVLGAALAAGLLTITEETIQLPFPKPEKS